MDKRAQMQFRFMTPDAQRSAIRRLALSGLEVAVKRQILQASGEMRPAVRMTGGNICSGGRAIGMNRPATLEPLGSVPLEMNWGVRISRANVPAKVGANS